MELVFLVAANMAEATHYKSKLLDAQDPRFVGKRIVLVTPLNGHHQLRGLNPQTTTVYVMDCAWRNYSRAHECLHHTLSYLKAKGMPVMRLMCGRTGRYDNENGDK